MLLTELNNDEMEKVVDIFNKMRGEFDFIIKEEGISIKEVMVLRSCLNELLDYQIFTILEDLI